MKKSAKQSSLLRVGNILQTLRQASPLAIVANTCNITERKQVEQEWETLPRLCRLTTEVLSCDCSHIVLWQPEEDMFMPVASYGETLEQWETLQVVKVPRVAITNLLARMVTEDVTQVITATQPGGHPAGVLLGTDVAAGFWMVLRRGEEIIGGLSVGYRQHPGPLTAQQERLARSIAQLASRRWRTPNCFGNWSGPTN